LELFNAMNFLHPCGLLASLALVSQESTNIGSSSLAKQETFTGLDVALHGLHAISASQNKQSATGQLTQA
jgi:hypothetical protein